MGWTVTKQTRAACIRELLAASKPYAIASRQVPEGLWTVIKGHDGKNLICFDLVEDHGGATAHKAMDETMGPMYHDCPLAFLELATDFAEYTYSAEWRKRVRKFWDDKERARRNYQSPERVAELERESHSDADPGL